MFKVGQVYKNAEGNKLIVKKVAVYNSKGIINRTTKFLDVKYCGKEYEDIPAFIIENTIQNNNLILVEAWE